MVSVCAADAESSVASSSGQSPAQLTLAAVMAHDSSMSDESLSFQSAGSESLSSATSPHPWHMAHAASQGSANLDWFDPVDLTINDSDSSHPSVRSATSSSSLQEESGEGAKAPSGLPVLLLRGLGASQQQQGQPLHNDSDGADLEAKLVMQSLDGIARGHGHTLSLAGLLLRLQIEVLHSICGPFSSNLLVHIAKFPSYTAAGSLCNVMHLADACPAVSHVSRCDP